MPFVTDFEFRKTFNVIRQFFMRHGYCRSGIGIDCHGF